MLQPIVCAMPQSFALSHNVVGTICRVAQCHKHLFYFNARYQEHRIAASHNVTDVEIPLHTTIRLPYHTPSVV